MRYVNYKKIQKVTSKKTKYKKITNNLKEKLRLSYVQGELDPQGFRRTQTIEDLADTNNLSKNTLYKLAQRENWKFQQEKFQKEYESKLDNQRLKEFAIESKKFDSACLNIAKAILARVGSVIRNSQTASLKDFTPQQLDSLASAAMKTQKFAKLALGESTDNINLNGNLQENETFRRAMELLDTVENSRSTSSKTTH
tara:strand:+ start:1552 stop:2145 length:594 start_codon:yes stop_codon:yes gene_type:complete